MNTNNVIKLKRKRIKKINPLWIIAGLLAAILIAVLVILVRGGAEGIAETGSVTVDVDYNAVIVRKEKVITSEAFDLADYFAEEGAWVEPDTKIMQIYRRGYSEEQAAALMRKHAEIYDEQLALLGETRDKTIRGYNELIALLEENIAEELMAGNSAEVPRQEAELLDALSSRTDYLRKNLQETETLRALYSQADALAEVVETQRHVLYSQESGFVSFYFDDYENALNADKKKDMAARRDIINSAGAAAVISIHMNKFGDRSVSGPMAFYMKGSVEGEKLAKCVLDGVCGAIGRPLRHVNPGDYYIIKNSEPPSVILECGFLSNANDEALLQNEEHMRAMMKGAAEGILKYVEAAEEKSQ